MNQVVVLCVDGSEASIGAAATGLARLAPPERTIVVTVVDVGDPTLVTGVSGMAGGALTPDQLEDMDQARIEGGQRVVEAAVEQLGVAHADTQVLVGDGATELTLFAADVGATVLVVGTRGLGAIKRALLGSVSTHLIRHAPCPVLVVRDDVED